MVLCGFVCKLQFLAWFCVGFVLVLCGKVLYSIKTIRKF